MELTKNMNDGAFTFLFYNNLIKCIEKAGYKIVGYEDCFNHSKCVILRHDIDFSISKAYEMALLENSLGITSTYFVLLKTDFYNPLSESSVRMLKKIIGLGHKIGLHWDEKSYPENVDVIKAVNEEKTILQQSLCESVGYVSMHRPSKKTLAADYEFGEMINSYSATFFKEFKYLSDSRMCWREPIMDVIESQKYDRLHILTHPFWYSDSNSSLHDKLYNGCMNASVSFYDNLDANFTDLGKEIKKDEICNHRMR